jgi:hypothetical protein
MSYRRAGVSRRENTCIQSLVRAVNTGKFDKTNSGELPDLSQRLGYIEALSEELAIMSHGMNEGLLCYFFRMAAAEARHGRERLTGPQN